jgi:quinol monooxygenase YgiN
MIHVIAGVTLKQGCKAKYLKLFKQIVPTVRAEAGCIAYGPTVDIDSGLEIQGPVRPNVVTIVEAWESLDHLRAHLATPHMAEYFQKTRDLVEEVSLQVLKSA